MANKQLQLRRGTATATDSFAGAEGEITYVTDTKTVRVFDGSTDTGGTELLKADMANVSTGGTTVVIDAKVKLSDNAYATANADDDLTLATKGWVSTQGGAGGIVGSQNNVGDTTITSSTIGDFLVYQGASASAAAKWVNKKIAGDVNVDYLGASVIQSSAVETGMIADANVTNDKIENPNVVVTDGTTAHTLTLGSTLTFTATANETTVVSDGNGAITVGIVDAPQLGNVTASTLSVTNDLTVGGDLTVSGSVTTVNTETINLADNLITLNSNETGAASENAGIEVERGTDANVALRWNESNSGVGSHKWQVTEDGSTYYDIVNVGDTGTVSSTMIAGDAITAAKIANGAIDSEHYVAGSIDNEHIADDTITSAKLANFTDTLTATAGHIVAGNGSALTSYETAGDVAVTVSGGTLTFGITGGVIVDADVNASAAIAGSKLAANTVTSAQIANTGNTDTIQTANIADSAIQAAKISNAAVTKDKLHANVAGDGISGGAGTALAVDLHELTAATIAVGADSIAFIDADGNASRKESVADLVNAISGSDMTATAGVLSIDQFSGVTAGAVSDSRAVLVDSGSNISGFGVLAASTLTGTLNGQVSTASQSSITSIANLVTVGTLASGAIASGFGSIDVGTSSIDGGTITAVAFSGPLTGNVTGNISGELTGELQSVSQPNVTTMTALTSVGALDSGSITSGFTSISIGNGAISGGNITSNATITDGTATLASGTLTANKVVVDNITIDGSTILSSGALDIESVRFTGQGITNVSDLTASGTITADAFSGDLSGATATLTGAVQGGSITDGTASLSSGALTGLVSAAVDDLAIDDTTITQGNSKSLTISAAGTVTVESVVFTGAAVTGVSDLTASGTVTADTLSGTLNTAAQPNVTSLGTLSALAVDQLSLDTHILSSSTIMQISAGSNKAVSIESISINDGAVTGVSTLSTSGDVTLGGDLAVNGGDITSTAATLSIDGASAVAIESVNFANGVISNATSLTASGSIQGGTVTDGTASLSSGALSGLVSAVVDELTIDDTTITQAGSGGTKDLTVSASNGNVIVESVTFNAGAVTNVSSLTASGVITANTFDGSFSGTVSSDVLTSSTLTVTSRFSLDTAGFVIDGTEVTSTAAELNFLDGSIAGTGVASKAVVLDSDKRVTGLEKITINNANAGQDCLTLTNGNLTLGTGNVVLTQGDLTINSRFEVGPNSVVTSTANEMRFEDSLLELNYDSNASLSDSTNLERQGGIWMQADKDVSASTTGLLVDTDSDWYLIKGSAKPNANYLSGLSSKTRADLYVGGVNSSGAVTLATTTLAADTTLNDTHHIVFCNNVTNLTLPGAVAGREYIIRNIHATNSVNIITSTVDSTKQGLDGVTDDSTDLTAGSKLHIVSDGSNWYSI